MSKELQEKGKNSSKAIDDFLREYFCIWGELKHEYKDKEYQVESFNIKNPQEMFYVLFYKIFVSSLCSAPTIKHVKSLIEEALYQASTTVDGNVRNKLRSLNENK